MSEVNQLTEALKAKQKLVAMIAPSFPIVFQYPHIITMLRQLGFNHVIEVAVGAKKTNEQLLALLKANPQARYITSPCPTIVRMIRKQMPEYVKYLTPTVDSPMTAAAKIAKELYPDHKPVFIGPCIVKKLEAKEDVPELNILVLTYAEINQVFDNFQIKLPTNPQDKFDNENPGMTQIYAIEVGLSQISGLTELVKAGQVQIVSNWSKCKQAIEQFPTNTKIRLLDILFCEGGCIGGPGIKSELTKEQREKKILDYWKSQNSTAKSTS